MMNYKYAYLTGCFIFGIIWTIIFIKRPDLRKEQLFMSIVIAFFGLTEPLFFNQYWKPEFIIQIPNFNLGFESIILDFFYGGIAAVIYEYIFRDGLKYTRKVKKTERRKEIILALISAVALFFFFFAVLKLNIIYATSLELFGLGAILLYFRHDLLLPSFVSGIIMAVLAFAILLLLEMLFPGLINSWWQINLLSGITFLGIPIEEFLWHFALGFGLGSIYEVWKGLKIINN